MNVKLEDLGKSMLKLTVEVPFEELDKAAQKVYNRRKNSLGIPGFRKGHTPRAMVEKIYGRDLFYQEAANDVLNDTYPDAVKQADVKPQSRAEVDIITLEPDKPLVYTAVFAVKPKVELGQYKGVKVEKADSSVKEEDIDREIENVRRQNARIKTVEDKNRAIKKDDTAIIDFEGFVDGVAFDGGKGEDYSLIIGSHTFVDNFEDQLIGHKIDDEVDVNVTFPQQYAENLAGKKALFKVKVKGIKENELPELNDEFASEVSEFETLKEYKDSIKADLKAKKEKWAANENENRVVKAIVEAAKVDVPRPIIEMSIDRMVENFERQITSQGIPVDKYLEYLGMDKKKEREQFEEDAVRAVKTRLIMEAVVKAEDIKISDEEVDKKIEGMANSMKIPFEEYRKYVDEDNYEAIREDLAVSEAIDSVVADAELVEPEKTEKA